MPEPITMATVAAASEAGAAAAEGTAAAGAAAGGTEVAGALGAGGEAAGAGAAAKSTEAFVGTLKADAPAVAETMLGRAQASGAELANAMGKGTGMEVGRATLARGAETATSGAQGFDPREVVRVEANTWRTCWASDGRGTIPPAARGGQLGVIREEPRAA